MLRVAAIGQEGTVGELEVRQQTPAAPVKLRSEQVIINAPMSYAGAAQRSFRIRRTENPWVKWLVLTPAALAIVVVWWSAVTVWYIVTVGFFGIITIPYRLLRRGARKRKAEALRHRELLDAVNRDR